MVLFLLKGFIAVYIIYLYGEYRLYEKTKLLDLLWERESERFHSRRKDLACEYEQLGVDTPDN